MENKSELFEFKLINLSDKAIKTETEMKTAGLKIHEHDNNLKSLNKDIEEYKKSLHKTRNIINPVVLKVDYIEEDIKNIKSNQIKYDAKLNEFKLNLNEITCIFKNYSKKSDELVDTINNLIKPREENKEKIVLNAKSKAIIIGAVFTGILSFIKVIADTIVKYN